MDILLTAVPHFRVPTGRRIDHRKHRRTSTETYRQHELLCSPFDARPTIGIRYTKEVSCNLGTTIVWGRDVSWQGACLLQE